MQTGFNSMQESSLEMTLIGLRQEKYVQLFNKKGVTKFDTFVNMTEEDMIYLGVTDDSDRKQILDGIEPLKHLYKDINEVFPPDLDIILGNSVHHLRTHLGVLIILRKQLQRMKPANTLIDCSHSSVNALNTLLQILKTQISYIEDDLAAGKMEEYRNKMRRRRRNCLYVGLIASPFIIAIIASAKYFGLNPLDKFKYSLKYF